MSFNHTLSEYIRVVTSASLSPIGTSSELYPAEMKFFVGASRELFMSSEQQVPNVGHLDGLTDRDRKLFPSNKFRMSDRQWSERSLSDG